MAKYLSTVFRVLVTRRHQPVVAIPNGVHVLLSKRHRCGSHPERRYDNSDADGCDAEHNRQRLLKVAVIGVPNAGKSSLINSVVQRNICPYSCKVHTTRCSARAVHSVGDTQLVFLDTPGLVDSKEIEKYNLEKAFASDTVNAIEDADIIGVIHDVSNRFTRNHLDPKVLRLLHLYPNKDSFLILNKIDLLKSKKYLLDLARSLTCHKHNNLHVPESYVTTAEEREALQRSKVQERMLAKKVRRSVGWDKFSDVFMVSAIHNHGSSDIREYLLQKSKPSPWLFPNDVVTDKNDYELAQRIVESKLYDDLPNEVPYNLKVELEYFEISREGNIHVVVLIHCNTPRIEKLVMGRRGRRIRDIAQKSEQCLRDAFMTDVFLKMVVTKKQTNSIPVEENVF